MFVHVRRGEDRGWGRAETHRERERAFCWEWRSRDDRFFFFLCWEEGTAARNSFTLKESIDELIMGSDFMVGGWWYSRVPPYAHTYTSWKTRTISEQCLIHEKGQKVVKILGELEKPESEWKVLHSVKIGGENFIAAYKTSIYHGSDKSTKCKLQLTHLQNISSVIL